jgi:hypothetical protein
MTWVATAVIGSAVVGGLFANSAAQTQADASIQASQIQQNMFNQTVANEAPYTQAGYGAQNYLNFLLGIPSTTSQGGGYGNQGGYGGGGYGPKGFGGGGFDRNDMANMGASGGTHLGGTTNNWATGAGLYQVPNGQTPSAPAGTAGTAGGFGSLLKPFTIEDFHNYSPAYQFQLQQGQQGILNRDASSAGALSGAAQKDLMGFNQGLAQDAFTNAFNQYQTQQGNIYGRLMGVANQGQAAASNAATGGSSYANSIGANVANAGAARAGGQVAIGNSISSMASLPWLMNNGGASAAQAPAMDFAAGPF